MMTFARSDDGDIVTLGWLRKQALKGLLAVGVIIVGAAWRLSAQNSALREDVKDAKEAIPRIEARLDALVAAVQAGNKTQDSLLILMAERERRGR